jgi:hypothetical protein
MNNFATAGALAASLLVSGCAGMGDYFGNPKNDVQIARAAFSAALTLFHTVCDNSSGVPFCSLGNIQQAERLEQAVQDALAILDSLFAPDGKLAVSSDVFQADLQRAISAQRNFSDFINRLQADKTKAMALKAVR